MKKNQSGFTLVELTVVIMILAILTLIGLAIFTDVTKKAKEVSCQTVRYRVLSTYHQLNAIDGRLTLEDVLENENYYYFDKEIVCPEGGLLSISDGIVVCSIHGSTFLDVSTADSFNLDFSNMSDEDLEALLDLVITQNNDDWSIEEVEGKLVLTNNTTGENRIFFPVDFDTYTLTSNITLNGSNGYGIMIDSVTDDYANDSGYVFQFDAGYGSGEFVFRERDDGKESSPFVRIKPEDVIPNYDPDTFWNDPHEIIIDVVNYTSDQNQMVVYIDGVNITVDKPVYIDKTDNETQDYIGFRTWGSSQALIDDLTVISNE